MTHRHFASALLLLAPLAAHCGPVTGPDPRTDAGTTPDAPVTSACPTTTAGPTLHDSLVDTNETWTAAAGPHIVSNDTRVAEGATLTIEPCATVIFRAGASLTVARAGAQLLAEGTAERPITMRGEDGARWNALSIQHPARATLRHVFMSDGGGDRFLVGATLHVRGVGTTPVATPALVDHVTITGSLGPGVLADRVGAFDRASTDLVITGSGSEEVPFPAMINEHAIDTMPRGRYTGNRVDEILVNPEGANQHGGLQQDATMRDLGVPYRIGDSAVDRFNIGAGGGEAPQVTVLTIEPGVVLRFHPNGRLGIEHYTGAFRASGVLRAVGTAARPIVFTSAARAPQPGDWHGLWYGGIPDARNQLEHVRLEYTGGECGCVLSTCNITNGHESAVIFTQPPPSAFIRNVRFVQGAGHGIFRGWVGAAAPDMLESNSFEDMRGCAQTLPPRPDGCDARPVCPQ